MEDAPTVDWVARNLASTQQSYTQQAGVRPFGISCLIAGVPAQSKVPILYMTDPAGTHSRWKAQVIGGRNAKSIREYLEQHYEAGSEAAVVKLAVTALLEVVDSGAKTMEVCVIRKQGTKVMYDEAQVTSIVDEIQASKEE